MFKAKDLDQVRDQVNKLSVGVSTCRIICHRVYFSLVQALRYLFAYFDGGDPKNKTGLATFLDNTKKQLSELSNKAETNVKYETDLNGQVDRMLEEARSDDKQEHLVAELAALKSMLDASHVPDYSNVVSTVAGILVGIKKLSKIDSLIMKPEPEPDVVNLTPHPVRVYDELGETILKEYLPSGAIARIDMPHERTGVIGGAIPMTRKLEAKDVVGLPEPKTNTFYIVSGMCKMAVPEREDCLVPDNMVRDPNGTVIGCRALRC